MMIVPLVLAACVSASPLPPEKAELPEDLGAETIDVSSYPPEYQETYRKIFLPLYGYLRGGPARAINSPLIEIGSQGEAALRREHPEFFTDSRLAQVAPDAWRREVMRIKNRPPCCGACPVVSMADARALWRFLAYDSLRRKTGPRAAAWSEYRRSLLSRYDAAVRGGNETRRQKP